MRGSAKESVCVEGALVSQITEENSLERKKKTKHLPLSITKGVILNH